MALDPVRRKQHGPSTALESRVAALCVPRRNCLHLGLLLCLLALWLTRAAPAALAQEPLPPDHIRIRQLRVQVMPEFDDPRLLVIVQGRLDANNLDFPVPITFRLPIDAQINQMASVTMDAAGSSMLPFTTQPDPADARWQLVSYNLDGAHFFYEYYTNPINHNDPNKAFSYTLFTYHPVDDASVEVQQPKTATNFATSPPASSTRLDQNLRLSYHLVPLGTLDSGQQATISVSYHKSDPDPSLTWEQVMALQQGLRPPQATSASTPAFPVPTEILVFLAGALLILAGAFAGYRLRLADNHTGEPEPGDLPGPTCRICGTNLKTAARYCHHCGAMVLPAPTHLEQAAASHAQAHSRLEVR
jgi:hypothetical protein